MGDYGTIYNRKKCCALRELFCIDESANDTSDEANTSNKRLKTAPISFTMRLEHREGEDNKSGEERILLFRSDHPGVIAKVAFSSCPASPKDISSSLKDDEFEESELSQMAQAKIHAIEVGEPYRGRDLGGLLFTEVVSALRNRCDSATKTDNDDSVSLSIRCQLDAEEDSRRHNRLVNFYEQLGCSIKPRAKVRFLNHNKGETYRSIPMQIALRHASLRRHFVNITNNPQDDRREELLEKFPWSSLVGIPGGFLPIFIKNRFGKKIRINSLDHSNANTSVLGSKVEWLIVEDEKGFMFRSTHGHHLLACPDGRVLAVADTDNNQFESVIPHDWECFTCFHVPDTAGGPEYESLDYREARQNELWLFQTSRETYLSIDMESGCMTTSTNPSFWKANADSFTLQHTTDTPKKRQHYKQSWAKQSIKYVLKMKQQYSGFNLCKMDIYKALSLMKDLSCHCFKVKSDESSQEISIRSFLFSMAEEARKYGHPDWFQLVALM